MFMYNDIGKALVSLVYPIKHLNEPFYPDKSFLDNSILLITTYGLLFL